MSEDDDKKKKEYEHGMGLTKKAAVELLEKGEMGPLDFEILVESTGDAIEHREALERLINRLQRFDPRILAAAYAWSLLLAYNYDETEVHKQISLMVKMVEGMKRRA